MSLGIESLFKEGPRGPSCLEGYIHMAKTILDWIEKILFLLGTIATLGMAVVIFLQITARYLFNSPLPWPEEMAQFLFIIAVYLGVGLLEKDNAHIRCEFLLNKLSKKAETWFFIFGKVLTIFIIGGFLAGERTLLERVKNLSTPAAQVPLLWLHVFILFGLGCWLVYLLVTSIGLLTSLPKSVAADAEDTR